MSGLWIKLQGKNELLRRRGGTRTHGQRRKLQTRRQHKPDRPRDILGGMGISGSRKRFYKNVAASEEEIASMRRIHQSGTEISYQLVPDEPSKNLSSTLTPASLWEEMSPFLEFMP